MTKTNEPTLDEFDNWTDDDEQVAFENAKKLYQIKHVIKGDTYYARTPDNTLYKLPLSLSIHEFEALSNTDNDVESIAQLKKLLRDFAGAKQAESLEKQPVQVVINLLSDYATILTKTQGATLGK